MSWSRTGQTLRNADYRFEITNSSKESVGNFYPGGCSFNFLVNLTVKYAYRL